MKLSRNRSLRPLSTQTSENEHYPLPHQWVKLILRWHDHVAKKHNAITRQLAGPYTERQQTRRCPHPVWSENTGTTPSKEPGGPGEAGQSQPGWLWPARGHALSWWLPSCGQVSLSCPSSSRQLPCFFGDIWCQFVSFGPAPHIYQRGDASGSRRDHSRPPSVFSQKYPR